jgi:integrase
LSRDELRAVLVALGHSGYDLAARFLLLTAARLEEACGARWCEIDLDAAQWIIPGARRKNAKALTVPLSRQACELLAALGAGEPNGFVFTGAKGAKLQNWRRWQASINERSGTSNWHRHDLRRSAATILGEAGVAPHIVEIVLGHAEPHSQLASVYNKSKYLPEHRAALQLLADQLDEIAEGKTKIVRLAS